MDVRAAFRCYVGHSPLRSGTGVDDSTLVVTAQRVRKVPEFEVCVGCQAPHTHLKFGNLPPLAE